MTGSIYFLQPYAREEKTNLGVMGIKLGEIAPQPNSLSITPWPSMASQAGVEGGAQGVFALSCFLSVNFPTNWTSDPSIK